MASRTGLERWWRQLRGAAPEPAGPSEPARPMTVEARVEPDCTMLKVTGEIDVSTSPALSGAIDEHVGRPGVLVVDLSRVTFMDSTGLRALLTLKRGREACGERLAIICPPGPARLICEVAGVERHLRLYASPAEAAAELGRPPAG